MFLTPLGQIIFTANTFYEERITSETHCRYANNICPDNYTSLDAGDVFLNLPQLQGWVRRLKRSFWLFPSSHVLCSCCRLIVLLCFSTEHWTGLRWWRGECCTKTENILSWEQPGAAYKGSQAGRRMIYTTLQNWHLLPISNIKAAVWSRKHYTLHVLFMCQVVKTCCSKFYFSKSKY